MDWGIPYTSSLTILEGYCDSRYVEMMRLTLSDFVFTLGSSAISWKSCKQPCSAMSTMESEFNFLHLSWQEKR